MCIQTLGNKSYTNYDRQVNHMTIYDLIDDATRQKLNAKKPVVHRQSNKHKEKLSERELKELMGTNRQIHKKVNGKVKRK